MNFSDITVGIRTDGKRPGKLAVCINSILFQIPVDTSVTVCGLIPEKLRQHLNGRVLCIEHSAARTGYIGGMFNEIAASAETKYVILCDDDMIFPDGFFHSLENIDVVANQVLVPSIMNIDGSRYWDSAVIGGGNHSLVPFGFESRNAYVTGGFFITEVDTIRKTPFSETLRIGEAEDVEWSQRLVQHGTIVTVEPGLVVLHNDARCSTSGRQVVSHNEAHLQVASRSLFRRSHDPWLPRNSIAKFAQGEDGIVFLRGNWYEAEEWGIWARDTSAHIFFSTEIDNKWAVIEYVIGPDSILEENYISINGKCLKCPSTYPGPQRKVIDLSSIKTNMEWKTCLINFHFPSNPNLKGSVEARNLAFGLKSLCIFYSCDPAFHKTEID